MSKIQLSKTEKPSLKIVKIIDEYHVVINGGSLRGIESGDTFQVCAPSVEVKDPDTGASLGFLFHVKADIVATEVYPQMAVCRNKENIQSPLLIGTKLFTTRPAELNVDATQISGGYDNVIRIGDIVEKIEAPDTDDADQKD